MEEDKTRYSVKKHRQLMERDFTKEKHSSLFKISKEAFSDPTIMSGQNENDFINDHISIVVSCYSAQHDVGEKEVKVKTTRPTFLDWLLRREKQHSVNIKTIDILKEYPKELNDVYRVLIQK